MKRQLMLGWLALVLSIDAGSAQIPPLSGHELLDLCQNIVSNEAGQSQCTFVFRNALEVMHTRLWADQRAACVPDGFGPHQAMLLYRLEAQRFPHVLEVPAERLIQGMLLKYFPCTGT